MRSASFRASRRAGAALAGAVLVVSLGAGPALADVTVPLGQTADTTWHTNAMVRAIAEVGGRIYLGGRFTELRERSIQKTGGSTIAVTGLGALDASTGAGIAGFAPAVAGSTFTPTIYAMATWNQRLFVGGKFTSINGVSRRNLAAIDVDPSSPTYGSVVAGFKPNPNGTVWALAANANSLYVGGKFGAISGQSHQNVARYTIAGDGTVAVDGSWTIGTAGTTIEGGRIRDIRFDPDRPGSAFIVGHFATVTDGAGAHALRDIARVRPGGTVDLSFAPPQNFGNTNFGIGAFVDAGSDRVFLGTGGSDYVAAFSTQTGARLWKTDTNGQAQAVAMVGPALVVGGHFTVAGLVPGYTGCALIPFDPSKCAARTRIAAFNPADGTLGLTWTPSAAGLYNGVWTMLPSGGSLWIGGEFKKVTGVQHSYVARFS